MLRWQEHNMWSDANNRTSARGLHWKWRASELTPPLLGGAVAHQAVEVPEPGGGIVVAKTEE